MSKILGKFMRWLDIRKSPYGLRNCIPTPITSTCALPICANGSRRLPEFNDDPNGCNEKILEAIQMAWIDERS